MKINNILAGSQFLPGQKEQYKILMEKLNLICNEMAENTKDVSHLCNIN